MIRPKYNSFTGEFLELCETVGFIVFWVGLLQLWIREGKVKISQFTLL